MTRFAIPSGSTVLFIGDSITDCDRMTYAAPLGSGYVRTFTEMVTYHHPELDIRWLNHGVGGDVIADLRERWDDDVMAHEPHWLAVMIGINDCHGNIDGDEAWAEDAYERDFRDILERARSFSPRLVLLDPFYMASTDAPWPVDGFQQRILDRIAVYHRVVARMAREYSAIRVHTHAMFTRQLLHRRPNHFGPEPVHPDPIGHTLIALELYRRLTRDEEPATPSGPSRRRSSRRSKRR